MYSPYTCEAFGELAETDIEHIVARSEAHDSGLCSAPPELKREFARDIRNLTLSDPLLNRDVKGAKDASDWTPKGNKCWFAWRVIDVRRAYNLTIDRREADALELILTTCPESSPDTTTSLPGFAKGRVIGEPITRLIEQEGNDNIPTDRMTKVPLAAIAIDLFLNAAVDLFRPPAVSASTQFRERTIEDHLRYIENYLEDIYRGTCSNRKIC